MFDVTTRERVFQVLSWLRTGRDLAAIAGFQANALLERTGLQVPMLGAKQRLAGILQERAPGVLAGVGRFHETVAGLADVWSGSDLYLQSVLFEDPEVSAHPQALELLQIITGPGRLDDEGYPLIPFEDFQSFVREIPHLFGDGLAFLDWKEQVERFLAHQHDLPREGVESAQRVLKALETMTFTAAVTAPPDLWLAKQILSVHERLGTLRDLRAGIVIQVESYAQDHGMNPLQLEHDLHFLSVRGYLIRTPEGYAQAAYPASLILDEVSELPEEFRIDMTAMLNHWFQGEEINRATLQSWLKLRKVPGSGVAVPGWVADSYQIDLGYYLLPIVLGLRAAGLTKDLKKGSEFKLDRVTPEMRKVLDEAGLTRRGMVTELGARVFERGPGAYGIIGAYYPYLNKLEKLLKTTGERPWVERAANIFASKEANRKGFADAVAALKNYCDTAGFTCSVVIEHAMGLAVGIQEFVKVFGTDGLRFVGADYEEAAIIGARRVQVAGHLPIHMDMVQSNIGDPEGLIRYMVNDLQLDTKGAVMIAGNGFHEVRGPGGTMQTDAQMVEVFRKYREAGIRLIFIEQSGLSDEQILASAWNSYFAGFDWVHRTSGQRPRSPQSWIECAERAGYVVLPEPYSHGTRRLFPCPLPGQDNPPISRTYFCVPTM